MSIVCIQTSAGCCNYYMLTGKKKELFPIFRACKSNWTKGRTNFEMSVCLLEAISVLLLLDLICRCWLLTSVLTAKPCLCFCQWTLFKLVSVIFLVSWSSLCLFDAGTNKSVIIFNGAYLYIQGDISVACTWFSSLHFFPATSSGCIWSKEYGLKTSYMALKTCISPCCSHFPCLALLNYFYQIKVISYVLS